MKNLAFFILLALFLSTLAAAARRPLSLASLPPGIEQEQRLQEKGMGVPVHHGSLQLASDDANYSSAVATPIKRSTLAYKKQRAAATRRNRGAEKEGNKNMQVYQADYAAARTHPPTEPP